MPSSKTATCAWCGRELPEQPGRGRKRKYCGPSCKQRAYEQRNNVSGSDIPAEAVIIHPVRAAEMRDRLFELRCAAEDVATAHAEGADTQEIRHLCDELIDIARKLEKLR
ncbi:MULTISPECIES: hypothetical protein [unclassified Corynebacterium]|uniref:hypothetical protein n=1 Tax=unclassified Corynebacterium TaxID=2624378 RepID=UPI002A91702F|nr:hypothetical protein [Corynebacterium sp.]MDY5784655.1 hypothetical protein [Corynebacterium sp.]